MQTINPPDEHFYLLELVLEPDGEDADFYILMKGNESGQSDYPISLGERILIFRDEKLASEAVEMAGVDLNGLPLPTESSTVCDLPFALNCIQSEEYNRSIDLSVAINSIVDLLEHLKLPFLESERQLLVKFADHVLFNENLAAFFVETGITREKLTHAVFCAVGAIFSRVRLVT